LKVVFPPKHLEELLLPEDQLGLYDIEHLKQFYTLLKSQNEQETHGLLTAMKDQKDLLAG
jgi:hypothetical protein